MYVCKSWHICGKNTHYRGNINSRNVHDGPYIVIINSITNSVWPILIGCWLLCIGRAGVPVRPLYTWPKQPSQSARSQKQSSQAPHAHYAMTRKYVIMLLQFLYVIGLKLTMEIGPKISVSTVLIGLSIDPSFVVLDKKRNYNLYWLKQTILFLFNSV